MRLILLGLVVGTLVGLALLSQLHLVRGRTRMAHGKRSVQVCPSCDSLKAGKGLIWGGHT